MNRLDEHFDIDAFGRDLNAMERDLEENPILGDLENIDEFQARRAPVVAMLETLYSETQFRVIAASLAIEVIGPDGGRVFHKITTDALGRPLAWPAQRAHEALLSDGMEFDMTDDEDDE